MKFIIVICSILIQIGVTIKAFKTIDLCPEKEPRNDRKNWFPNSKSSRDLMTKFVKFNEERLMTEEEYYQDYYGKIPENKPNASERIHVGNKTPVLGSMDKVTDPGHDAGLLSTIYEAYGNHYNLRTGPEDWWYTIIQTVALAIDENSKSDKVRQFFVQHEGKKELEVIVGPPPLNLDSLDYTWLFDQFSQKIEENINVPEYVQQMIPDFSTTTSVHRIVSQITLMTSVQEFFEYSVGTLCGIPAIEMKGETQDWMNLKKKIKALRKTLEPIEDDIGLGKRQFGYVKQHSWWNNVEKIAEKLLDTFEGNPDEEWWSKIITEKSYGSGSPDFNGWFMEKLLNIRNAKTIGSAPSGLVSIPMKFSDPGRNEKGAVIAGMAGYKFHHPEREFRPAVEPMHGWSLLLEPNSVFRNDLSDWEKKINGIPDSSNDLSSDEQIKFSSSTRNLESLYEHL